MEIRHQHGSAESVWKLDMFYMFEPDTKQRNIDRVIDSLTLSLDGPYEEPAITYVMETKKDSPLATARTVAKRALLTFSRPRSGSVIAQLKEVRDA